AAAAAPGALTVSYHLASAPSPTTSVSFEVTLFNHSAQPVKLDGTTLRYWIDGDASTTAVAIDWASIGTSSVDAKVASSPQGNQAGYLEIGFHDVTLPAYGTTGPILVRYHRIDWGSFDPSRDDSFGRSTADQPWPRIGLYQDGRLVSGKLP
ncbi:MAG: cellulose binding domain-containing protein, partial [Chloroflexota bacterium]